MSKTPEKIKVINTGKKNLVTSFSTDNCVKKIIEKR
jgi:hypothetical protein